MSIPDSTKSVKNISENKSVNFESRSESLKLTQYKEGEKYGEIKVNANDKDKVVVSKFKTDKKNLDLESNYSNKNGPIINKDIVENNMKNIKENVKAEKFSQPQSTPTKNLDDRTKTIICWNCDDFLLVSDDWDLVQCTHCEKLNRISNHSPLRENNEIPNKFNSRINHFETNIPYIFVIVICPYCGKQNKAHKGTQHIVCYKCNHSMNIESDSSGGDKVKFHTSGSTLTSYDPNSIRFSDLAGSSNENIPNLFSPQNIYRTHQNAPSFNQSIYSNNYPIDYYYYPYGQFNNFYPPPMYQNFTYNPPRSVEMDYYIRKRLKRNNRNEKFNNPNPYEDKEIKNGINKVRENLNKIHNDFGIDNSAKSTLKNNLSDIKDQIENNKSAKNEAIYKSIIMRK